MTSTSTYQGMNPDARPTSRVLAQPGGKTSINLFGGDDPAPAAQAPRKQTSTTAPSQPPPPESNQGRHIRSAPKPVYNTITGELIEDKSAKKQQQDEEEEESKENEQSSVGARPAAAKQPAATQKPAAPVEKSSTRVSNPPGGKSSFSLG